MTLTDTARAIGVSIPTAYKMMSAGDFPAALKTLSGVKTRRWYIEDVMKWIEAHK